MKNNSLQKTFTNMIKNASFELYPEEGLVEKALQFPKKSHLAITCTSKKGIDYTLDTVTDLKKNGYSAYPHIVARLVENEDQIKNINKRLEENNIDEIFVAAGDLPKAVGKYESSMDLLSGFEKVEMRLKTLFITGYPEGHPYISKEKLLEALKQKQEFSVKTNINIKIITQLCFDADVLVEWTTRLREQGITLPIVIGFAGPCNWLKLLKFGVKCGVGQSLKFISSQNSFRKNFGTHLTFQYTPDTLMRQIVENSKFSESNIAGFHFYTFNNIDAIIKWRTNIYCQNLK